MGAGKTRDTLGDRCVDQTVQKGLMRNGGFVGPSRKKRQDRTELDYVVEPNLMIGAQLCNENSIRSDRHMYSSCNYELVSRRAASDMRRIINT